MFEVTAVCFYASLQTSSKFQNIFVNVLLVRYVVLVEQNLHCNCNFTQNENKTRPCVHRQTDGQTDRYYYSNSICRASLRCQ